jgi:alpha-2-macroglobulin
MFSRCLLFPLIVISLLLSPIGVHPQAANFIPQPSDFLFQDAPLLAEVDPSIDLEKFHPRAVFSVRFNQSMDTSNDTEPVLIYPYLAGEYIWKDGNTVLEFVPLNGFASGAEYEVYLGRGLRAQTGQEFDSQPHWSIKTLPGPKLVSKSTGSEMAWGKQPSTKLVFDMPMDRATVAAALRVVPDITLDLSWDGNQLTIAPALRAEPGTRYHLTLLAGEGGVRSLDGIPLDDPLQWSWYVPEMQASLWGVSELGFDIVFNYHLDRIETALAYRIEPKISGSWTWTSNSRQKFVASQRLKPSVQYKLYFDGPIYSEAGELVPNPDPVEFSIPAPIRSVQPVDVDWKTNTNEVSIHFSRSMDHASIERAFSIDPPTPGTFIWVGNLLIYRFDTPLEKGPSQRFTVTLGTSARDEAGEPILREPYSWSYDTFDYSYDRDANIFGFGALDQVVDVNGRRAVHVGVKAGWVTYKLYRLELGDFVRRHKPSMEDSSPWDGIDVREPDYTWPVNYLEGNVDEVVLPNEVEPGLYILTGRGPENQLDHLFVTLTRNSLLVKVSPDELMVWMTDINGEPVGGSEVRMYATSGEHVQGCLTQDDGTCRIMLPPSYYPMLVIGRGEGNDVAISGVDGNWYKYDEGLDWWNWYDPSYIRGRRHVVYTYTERPIYRPGQEVNFKSILRYDRDVRYSLLPTKTPVKVNLRDGRDNIVQSLDLETGAFSSVNGSFHLSEGAMLGGYRLEVIIDKNSYLYNFEVQEYRKPDVQAIVKTDSDRYVVGDAIKVDVEVRTYSGTPVANATLKITSSQGVDRREKTDPNGRFTMTIPAREPDNYSYWEFGTTLQYSRPWIQVSVDDGSFQDVVGSTHYWLYNANTWVRFERLPKLIIPGQPFDIAMIAQTLGGEPAPGVKLELQQRQYDYKRWEYKVQEKLALETDESGKALISWQISKSGHYNLNLQLKDERNNILGKTDANIYIHASNSAYEIYSDEKTEITAERDKYKPYETAQLVIESTLSGPALLTFERGRVIHTQPVNLTAPITVVSTPVLPEYAPNIYVTLNAYDWNNTLITDVEKKDSWYISSKPDSLISIKSVELRVDATEKALQIDVQSDAEHYRPRQDATFNIYVRDQQGQPVDAELSIAVVDESIFSIFTDRTPAIFNAFYGPRAKTVSSYYSFGPGRYWYSGDRGGGGDEAFTPRSDFPDTAIWIPALRTGSDGEISVTVKLPDSLTSWRVTVKAATASSRVGEASINVETRQDVVLRPVLPAAVMVGDAAQLNAMVYNNTAEPREMNVSVTGTLFAFESQEQTVTVAPGTSRMVSWNARAIQPGEESLLFYLNAGDGYQDAVRISLPVKSIAVLEVMNQTGVLLDERKLTLLVPEDAMDSSTIEIELSRSIAGSLLEGLDFLTGYPYGCVEQTLSKALPNAAVGRAYSRLGISEAAILERLPEYIADGVIRLSAMQQFNGSWGWWYDDSSSAYLTSLVVFGLAVTADAGYPMDALISQRGAKWLVNQYADMNLNTQPFALYALSIAGQGQPDLALALFDQANDLDAFSLASLALVLDIEGYSVKALSLLDMLADSAVRKGDQVYWLDQPERAADNSRIMASQVRSTAMALMAYLRLQKEHVDIPMMVRYLMNARSGKGWSNTNDTTFAILALTDYVAQTLHDEGNVSYRMEIDGRDAAAGSFETGKPTVKVTLPASELETGLSLLTLEQQGADHVYYRVTSVLQRAEPEIDAGGVIKVTRSYTDSKTKKAVTTFVQGQLVEVNLTVDFPANLNYVILEDYLPGGFEALNERLNHSTFKGTQLYSVYWYDEASPFFWSDYGYNQKEVRPDRVTFFITEPGAGIRRFTYLARITHAGTFTALPTEIQAMYKPELWGRSQSNIITVNSP